MFCKKRPKSAVWTISIRSRISVTVYEILWDKSDHINLEDDMNVIRAQ
jgi:hypothetical protein